MAASTVSTPTPGGTNPRGGPPQRHLRKDRWWFTPALYVVVLGSFVVYSTWAIIIGTHFSVTAGGRHYVSPFYSPCTANACGKVATPALGTFFGGLFLLSRLVWMIFPLSFRATCYYYRKAYYRSFFLSPPACAVEEPHKRYTGERRFPLVLQNSHRVWWYIASLFILVLGYDAAISYDFGGSAGMGLGSLILTINVILLALYTFGCHSCRHILGGRLNHFSKHPIRYRLWTWVSKLNARHGSFAWASLIFVAVADIYIRLVSYGAFHDPRFF